MHNQLNIEKYTFYDKKCYDHCCDDLILDIYYLDNCDIERHKCIDFSKYNSNYNYCNLIFDDIKCVKCLKFNRYIYLRLYYIDGHSYEDLYDCEFYDVGYGLCKMIIQQYVDRYDHYGTRNLYIKSKYNCGYTDCPNYVYSGITNIYSSPHYCDDCYYHY